ncbi:unnamed protein product, partial [Mesorhabditis spiculigera]
MLTTNQQTLIELSVGGKFHDTTLATLLSDQDSMLAAMFSGRWDLPKTEAGRRFIDRDGTHFAEILNHLRGTHVLPNEADVLEKLLEEAKYYQLRPLVARIEAHDLFVRPVHVIYQQRGERSVRGLPLVNFFQLAHLRRERDSFLARTAQKLYDNGSHHSRVLTIILGRAHDDLSATALAHKPSFYTPATDRTAFADFDATITIGADLNVQISALSILRRGRARELLLKSALDTVFHYLRTGEVHLHFCLNEFRRHLEKDYTRLTEEAASGTAIDTAREPRLSWIDVINQMNSHSIIDDLVMPLVCDVAGYFGLQQFVRLSKESALMKKKPFLRTNSI